MKSLFLRIFLSFWAAQALFLVLAILVTIAIRPRHGVENLAPQALAETVSAYQNGGEPAAFHYLEGFQHADDLSRVAESRPSREA